MSGAAVEGRGPRTGARKARKGPYPSPTREGPGPRRPTSGRARGLRVCAETRAPLPWALPPAPPSAPSPRKTRLGPSGAVSPRDPSEGLRRDRPGGLPESRPNGTSSPGCLLLPAPRAQRAYLTPPRPWSWEERHGDPTPTPLPPSHTSLSVSSEEPPRSTRHPHPPGVSPWVPPETRPNGRTPKTDPTLDTTQGP